MPIISKMLNDCKHCCADFNYLYVELEAWKLLRG